MKVLTAKVLALVLGLLPIIFAGTFLTSSISIYTVTSEERDRRAKTKEILSGIPNSSRTASLIDAFVLTRNEADSHAVYGVSACGLPNSITSSAKKKVGKGEFQSLSRSRLTTLSATLPPSRESWMRDPQIRKSIEQYKTATSISGSYQTTLADLATLTYPKEHYKIDWDWSEPNSGIEWELPLLGISVVVTLDKKEPYERYFYNRLALESLVAQGQITEHNYHDSRLSLAKAYLALNSRKKQAPLTTRSFAKRSTSEASSDQSLLPPVSANELHNARIEINTLQGQVASLREEVRLTRESAWQKQILIIIAVLTFFLAVSSNLIAWRADRRQLRDAELLPLKQRELEQSVLEKARQLESANCRVVMPTEDEINTYSIHNSFNNSS